MVPGGGIANGGSGRFRQINQIRASIEYNKLSGISILSSVSTETIATIVFRQAWTPTQIWGCHLWTPIVPCERAVHGQQLARQSMSGKSGKTPTL
jgi:hypothetical protein